MNDYTINDIFDPTSPYFNGALNLSTPPNAQLSGLTSTGSIGTGEQAAQLDAISTKLPEITVDPTSSIQIAIDKLNTLGGGIINLLAGTYYSGQLTGYSSIEIHGVSPSATIIDFGGTSANLSFTGTNVYTAGTITSITSGVNVTGSGTSWLANVTAGQHIFIGTRWYEIAAVTGNTTLILSEGYGDSVTMPGAAYRIASVKQNVTLKNLAINNSSGTGLVVTDSRKFALDGVVFQSNNKGVVFTNVSEINTDRTIAVTSTSNGFECTNVGLADWSSVNSISNGGSGFVFNNVKTFTLLPGSATSNTVDGFNLTTVVDLIFIPEASGNGGQGIEMVSGNSNITILAGPIKGNTSDGIKFTASSDQIRILSNDIASNGGYGVNIADSTCNDAVISSNNFATNTSGAVNDLGTGTVIRGNIGVNDNSTGSLAIAGLFGSGVDGDVTITGTTTLSADMNYNNLTINSGAVLKTNGYAVYVLGTLTTIGTGKIHNNGTAGGNGGNASSGVVGTAGAAGTGGAGATFTAGKDGGAGVAGVLEGIGTAEGNVGIAGTNANPALGGAGGSGGTGGKNDVSGTQAGGTGGTATSETVLVKSPSYAGSANLSGTETTANKKATGVGSSSGVSLSAGAGGGSGGSGDVGQGGGGPYNSASGGSGGGGGGGGVVFIAAKTITNAGTISSNGGNGGDAGTSYFDGGGTGVAGSGGGGGGGGGAVILVYETLNNTGSITASAGSGGTYSSFISGGTSGTAGSAGSAGTVYKLKFI